MVIILYYVWLVTLVGVLSLQAYRLINGILTIFTYADVVASTIGIIGGLLSIANRSYGWKLLLFASGSFFGITIVSLTYRFTSDLISPIIYGVFYLLILSIITAFYIVRGDKP